jgi:hypothetical protein
MRTIERVILAFYIWRVKIQNRRWLYLDDHLDKLLEDIFHQNIYFYYLERI